MAFIKCPRCELNYMQDTEKYCSVCRREMHGEEVRDDLAGMCAECGEHPALPGEELCFYCYREIKRQEGIGEQTGDAVAVPDEMLDVTAASAMDEIVIELGEDDMPDAEFKAIGQELGMEDEEPAEESELVELQETELDELEDELEDDEGSSDEDDDEESDDD